EAVDQIWHPARRLAADAGRGNACATPGALRRARSAPPGSARDPDDDVHIALSLDGGRHAGGAPRHGGIQEHYHRYDRCSVTRRRDIPKAWELARLIDLRVARRIRERRLRLEMTQQKLAEIIGVAFQQA